MGKNNKQHKNRELQYMKPAPADDKIKQPPVLGVIVHKSRLDSAPEAMSTRGVLQDIQEKYLQLLSGIDDDTSIAIALTLVPKDFKFPEGEKENAEDDQKQLPEGTSDDNNGENGSSTEPLKLCTEGLSGQAEGTVSNGSEDDSGSSDDKLHTGDDSTTEETIPELNLDADEDPFKDVEEK